MTSGYGISPLGTYGLDMSGAYTSYDPYMMSSMGLGGMSGFNGMYGMTGMNGLGTMSPYAMGNMGMMGMGMYNPSFLSQYQQVQNEMELNQVQHQADMNKALQQVQVQNLSAQERALFESAMANGDVEGGIQSLAQAVRSGNQDAICQKYDALKNIIYKKHGEYFRNNSGKMTTLANVNNLINTLYEQKMGADLRTEIKQYGDSAFWHGFHSTFLNKDIHKRYSEETLRYCFGDQIDNEKGKQRVQKIGGWTARVVEPFTGGVAGAGIGAVAGGIFGALFKNPLQGAKIGAKLGAGLGFFGDIAWQVTREQ